MTTIIKAHYDGKTIIPDEKVDLPLNTPLRVEVRPILDRQDSTSAHTGLENQHQLERITGMVRGPILSQDALRRDGIYE
ncbi:MAG: antitoxin family protein [Candidatus Sumerlaeaceae bacterium]|nr:antitoxin family protein [Candidatus Sumerlaeaceae bacterium]